MNIAGTHIEAGENKQINIKIAKLISGTQIDMNVFVSRAIKPGPVLLLVAGLHGDEINSVDVIRQIMHEKINHVDTGTVICIPIINVFGFINFSREVPDGKDVNRSFPGHSKGSLASQIAHTLSQKIIPQCDYIIDFHTGGQSRFNVPQIRAVLNDEKCKNLADSFNAPYTLHSGTIAKSLRENALKQGKNIIVFEGGESLRFDQEATKVAIEGTKKVINALKMKEYKVNRNETKTLYKRKWFRAISSGFFHPAIKPGDMVEKNQHIGTINSPLADNQDKMLSSQSGYVVSLNNNPMVNRGDAIIQLAY